MKKLLIILLLISCTTENIDEIQKDREDMTKELRFMIEGWSLGNECNTTTGLFKADSVNLNGQTLEILDAELTINGDLIYNGGVLDSLCNTSKVIVNGNIIQ